MKYQNIVLTLIICSFLFSLSNTQIVDCIGYIKSIFATTGWCTSTSTDLRPINATGYMKILKNMSWYGADDWDPYILRDGYLIKNLYTVLTCFPVQPIKGKLYAGKSY